MSMNFQQKVIQYVICAVTLCGEKRIELENKTKSTRQIYMGNTRCYSIIAIGRGKSSSAYITYVQNNGTYLLYR